VIFFSTGQAMENPPKRLVAATADNRRALAGFLKTVRATGQTDPVPALKRAFEVLDRANAKPGQVVYLLTDGTFADEDAVIGTIARLNADKRVQIHTCLYQYRGRRATELMQRIAAENGGTFRYVSGRD
jgi:uncharacterized protein with von Willebrand factor type A (vWA) domain